MAVGTFGSESQLPKGYDHISYSLNSLKGGISSGLYGGVSESLLRGALGDWTKSHIRGFPKMMSRLSGVIGSI